MPVLPPTGMATLYAFFIAGFVALFLNAFKILLKGLGVYEKVKYFFPLLAMAIGGGVGYCYGPTPDVVSNVMYGVLAGGYAVGLYQGVAPKLYNEAIDAKML